MRYLGSEGRCCSFWLFYAGVEPCHRIFPGGSRTAEQPKPMRNIHSGRSRDVSRRTYGVWPDELA
jgi:hypothetical protein